MRETKFRGMLRSGEWVYGGYVKIKGGAYCILSGECDSYDIDGGVKNILKFNAVKYKTMGEYTGLKSAKDLTDIYEGDIIDMKGNIRGNIYESPEVYKALTTSVVAGMGYKDWEHTKQRLVRLGKLVAEQSDLPQILRELG